MRELTSTGHVTGVSFGCALEPCVKSQWWQAMTGAELIVGRDQLTGLWCDADRGAASAAGHEEK